MKFLWLLLSPVLYAAPTAVAWTTPTAPCWATTTGPCWASSTSEGAYPTLAVPWSSRAGAINQLVGTGSTGTGSSLTYAWSLAGPSTLTITSPTSATTTVTGTCIETSSSTYDATLVVTEHPSNLTDSITIHIGCLNIDANGVVTPADPKVTQIYGKLIALGYNPWGYQDERHVTGTMLNIAQNPYYAGSATFLGNASVWATNGTGTVTYPFAGFNPSGQTGATLTGNISATATTIPINNPGDGIAPHMLSAFPTWITIGGTGAAGSSGELVRIASCSATPCTGNVNLTVAYDGRNMANYAYGENPSVIPATMHNNTDIVAEMRIQGSSTLFATDSARPLCPGGVPGPPGPITYSTGTVRLAASSTTVTGTGTTWASPSTQAAYMIRVAATHGGGTPFIWWAAITTVGGTTSITASRPAPADVDTGTDFSYVITGQRFLALEFSDTTYGGTHFALQNAMGCESETAAFATPAHGIVAFTGSTESAAHYTYKNGQGAGSAPLGPNFYGADSAELQFYYRSGYTPALTASRLISNYWIRDPEFCGGYCTPSPLNVGGGFLGGVANTWLNGSALTSITDLRPWANAAVSVFTPAHATCNITFGPYDTRDQGYLESYLTLTAMQDSGSNLTTWLTALGSAGGGAGTLGRDQACKHTSTGNAVEDNSFAVGLLGSSATLTTTVNNAVVTGSGFASTICAGVASGTIQVTKDSASATLISGSLGTNPHNPLQPTDNYNIFIRDVTSSPNYVGVFEFFFSGTTVALAGKWPGASGTFDFLVQDGSQRPDLQGGGISIIAPDGSDASNPLMSEPWACTFNSSTQITLNRPWDNATGITGHTSGTFTMYNSAASSVGMGGYFQQPFMLGIKTNVLNWAANYVPNATINSGYSTILPLVGNWMHDWGYDLATNGVYYARVNLMCEPTITAKSASDAPGTTIFQTVHGYNNQGGCGYSGLLGSSSTPEYTERVNTAEAFPGFVAYFRGQCALGVSQCNAARTFVDKAYGALWGNCSMTSGGGSTYYCDTHYVDEELAVPSGGTCSLNTCKWYGFFFGEGMSSGWPAIRLEGTNSGTIISGKAIFSGAVTIH